MIVKFLTLFYILNGLQASEYIFDDQADGWLKLNNFPTSWNDAKIRCDTEDAVVATPINEKMRDAIIKFVERQNEGIPRGIIAIYTGVHADYESGEFLSIEGVKLSQLPVEEWMGTPNIYRESESCVVWDLIGYAKLRRVRCHYKYPFVCYKRMANLEPLKPSPVVTPVTENALGARDSVINSDMLNATSTVLQPDKQPQTNRGPNTNYQPTISSIMRSQTNFQSYPTQRPHTNQQSYPTLNSQGYLSQNPFTNSQSYPNAGPQANQQNGQSQDPYTNSQSYSNQGRQTNQRNYPTHYPTQNSQGYLNQGPQTNQQNGGSQNPYTNSQSYSNQGQQTNQQNYPTHYPTPNSQGYLNQGSQTNQQNGRSQNPYTNSQSYSNQWPQTNQQPYEIQNTENNPQSYSNHGPQTNQQNGRSQNTYTNPQSFPNQGPQANQQTPQIQPQQNPQYPSDKKPRTDTENLPEPDPHPKYSVDITKNGSTGHVKYLFKNDDKRPSPNVDKHNTQVLNTHEMDKDNNEGQGPPQTTPSTMSTPIVEPIKINEHQPTQPSRSGIWRFIRKAGGRFKLHEQPETFEEASIRCTSEGAVIASPLTNDLKNALNYFINKSTTLTTQFYIGVRANYSNGDFYSTEGVSLSKMPVFLNSGTFIDHQSSDVCIKMTKNDDIVTSVSCRDRYPYVCFKKSQPVHSCGKNTGYEYKPQTQNCYKFHNDEKTWSEAYRVCSDEGGLLAVINSKEEADTLSKLFNKYPKKNIKAVYKYSVYMGLRDWRDGKSWTTVKGVPSSGYIGWALGEPKNNECSTMSRRGLLHSDPCNLKLAFICEKDSEVLYDDEEQI